TDYIEGITVYLGRLVPVAVYGQDRRSKTYVRGPFGREKIGGSSFHFLEPKDIGKSPKGNWSKELLEITRKITEFGFYLASPEELNQELPFEVDIPTIIGGKAYGWPNRVMDALFYWED